MVMVEVEIILLPKGRKKLEKVDIESLTQGGQYLFNLVHVLVISNQNVHAAIV